MDESTAAENNRPSVPVGTHRRIRRRRLAIRWAWGIAWTLIVLSVVLAIFVHEGLLGISGLVGAVIVAVVMLNPDRWRRRDDDDDDATEE